MGYGKKSNFGGRHNFHNDKFDRGFDNRSEDRAPPVRVGDELNVTIETVAEKGDGLTKKDGFVIFVPGTKQGDHVRIRITKVLRRVGFAEKIGEATKGNVSNKGASIAEHGITKENKSDEDEKFEDSENFGEDSDKF